MPEQEMWVSRPELPTRCKFRIFKSRKADWSPWILVHPAYPTMESKRRATRYETWVDALQTMWVIQSVRDR